MPIEKTEYLLHAAYIYDVILVYLVKNRRFRLRKKISKILFKNIKLKNQDLNFHLSAEPYAPFS